MMGIQSGQIQMVILDMDSMIPEDHLLRRIKKDLLTNSLFQCLFLHVFLKCHKAAGKFGYSNRFYQPL